MSRVFDECRAEVLDRGRPPKAFLNELIDWAKQAPDVVFEVNDNYDIYSMVKPELGPYTSLLHRKAVMLEVLRVLAGFESSWNWNEDIDTTNPTSNTVCTAEAGILQCSANSMGFDTSLKALLRANANTTTNPTSCRNFRIVTKANHRFALEYCARLLRFTVNHHGPVKRSEINPWLRRAAVEEFQGFLED